MFDKITPRQQSILQILRKHTPGALSSGDILAELNEDIAAMTLRRDIAPLIEQGLVTRSGERKSTAYTLAPSAILHVPFTVGTYFEQDFRTNAQKEYSLDIIDTIRSATLFSDTELKTLGDATKQFQKNAVGLSSSGHKRELERFVIEFSWKSSEIEGNTYSLLDTEFLLNSGVKATGKSEFDAQMIINHKNAYLFAVEAIRASISINRAFIEKVHTTLTDNLGVAQGLRKRLIGITGTEYHPLTIPNQIIEQLEAICTLFTTQKTPYEKALSAVLLLSYLQAFEDGNKRTARLIANSLLLADNCAPLSYRNVAERDYKEAILIFYEQNSIEPFKQLFIEQYCYSATHYNIARA